MLKITGYQDLSLIYEGANSLVFQGVRIIDQQAVILKTSLKEESSLKALATLQHEFEVLKQLNVLDIRKAFELIKFQDRLFLVLEYVSGQSLANYLMS